MQLKPGTELQNGKYRIIKTLGQGGFGITYEAEQVLLRRKIALKEFFMKDCCERDESTSRVTVGTGSQRALVEKFRGKFIREAQMMAGLDHPNVVRVTDVFEENETAYYVMENLPGGSLTDKVRKEGPLSEHLAEKFIRQVAEGLSYIHSQNIVHLDVKPSNILLNAKGNAVLIDFGISKHYDEAGEQTSSTPVGISKGYAPLEQGRDGDISQFKPSTDIYALGATLYYLVTGSVPPEASIVNEDGLNRPKGVSDKIWNVIVQAMQPRRKDRPQSVAAFLSLLAAAPSPSSIASAASTPVSEETVIEGKNSPRSKLKTEPKLESNPSLKSPASPVPKKKSKTWLWALFGGLAVAAIILAVVLGGRKDKPVPAVPMSPTDSLAFVAPFSDTTILGSVKLSSTPSGATIWLDGTNTKKTTPEILEGLTPGKHSLKLTLDGYNDYTGSVNITSGKQTDCSKTLTAKEKPTSGTLNGHDWVDLGLPSGLKWATCNVGATKPEDYGSYFAWGETKTKSIYTWENYKFRVAGNSDETAVFNKYNTASNRGSVDNKKNLDLSDDVARAYWGNSWRMPTVKEINELLEQCSWSWTSQGEKKGFTVLSRTNGNSIFLPAGGNRKGSDLENAGSHGLYWSSSLYIEEPCSAWILSFLHSEEGRLIGETMIKGGGFRSFGFSVRPVSE